MSSDVSRSLPMLHGFKPYQERVDQLIVQIGHLGVHVDREDATVEYWFNLIRRSLMRLSMDLEEEDRAWREDV